jgi:hypothetical protein
VTGRLACLIFLLCAYAALAACGGSSTTSGGVDAGSDSGAFDGSAAIEVPDVSGENGASAVSDVEDAGLEVTLADANDDPGFDTSRDASGCEVTDQDPAAGEQAAEGDEVTVTVDCAQVDWENNEGAQWEDFNDGYRSGFEDGCQELFDQSPDGNLYENDVQYTATDCQDEEPGDASDASDVPSDVPDDPQAAGSDLGELDGCQALFENEGVTSLNYGTDSYTEDDCPIGAPAPSTSTSTSPSKPPSTTAKKTAGERCTGTEADGTLIVLKVTMGEVTCKGAVALLREWLRRAPTEGVGSGGYMKLYGWQCIAASANKPNRVGGCERSGADAAAFSVTLAGE